MPHWIEDVRKYAGSNIVQLLIGELGGMGCDLAGLLGTTDPICLSFFFFFSFKKKLLIDF